MPQQRRAQATRRAITLAAAEEFDRVGYDGTPLSAILRRGGVTKGAFYFHFSSKEALAVALVRLQARVWSRLWRRWKRRELDPLSIAVGAINEAMRLVERDVVLRAGSSLARRWAGFPAGDFPVSDFPASDSPASDSAASDLPAAEQSGVLDWERQLAELLRKAADSGLLRAGVEPCSAARVVHAAVLGAEIFGSQQPGQLGAAERTVEVWRIVLTGIASSDWLCRNLPFPIAD